MSTKKQTVKNCTHIPFRYVTNNFLMCKTCKKKIRKLNSDDKRRIDYLEKLAFGNMPRY